MNAVQISEQFSEIRLPSGIVVEMLTQVNGFPALVLVPIDAPICRYVSTRPSGPANVGIHTAFRIFSTQCDFVQVEAERLNSGGEILRRVTSEPLGNVFAAKSDIRLDLIVRDQIAGNVAV